MIKKKIHPSPMEYRIHYVIGGAIEESVQYYNVYHSSEALEFLAHTYRRGHIHGGELKVVSVEEYNRFTRLWEDRTIKASEHAEAPEIKISDTGAVFLNLA